MKTPSVWGTLREWVRRLLGTLLRNPSDHELKRELALHLELAEEELRRQGHSTEESARLARVRFGGLSQAMEPLRDQRGLPWVGGFWLDIKLGFRMLKKSWGLTLVGGLAMTIAIAISIGIFALFDTLWKTTVPLDEGDQVVSIMTWDARANRRDDTSLQDLARWRGALKQVEDVGAFRQIERSLATSDGPINQLISVAEISASAFELARVPPLMGRPILRGDELVGASPVLVIGHEAWKTRFDSNPSIVGQDIQLDGAAHTVVGVMPKGFAFPIDHGYWTPLQEDPSAYQNGSGPGVLVFARLAADASLKGAQAELTAIGLLPPTEAPKKGERRVARVVSYPLGFVPDIDQWVAQITLLLVSLLLVPPCANIAILVYARMITRQEEFAARYALGASRARIVTQLFIETLALSAAASGLALLLVRLAFSFVIFRDGKPFWLDLSLSISTVIFAALLATFAAIIAGLAPALKATGREMRSGLGALGNRTKMKLGTTWTVLVIAQVALSLAALPTVVEMAWGTLRAGVLGPGFAADRYLTAQLVPDKPTDSRPRAEAGEPSSSNSFGALRAELVRQLLAEPGVLGVTVSASVPGAEPWGDIEIEGIPIVGTGMIADDNRVRYNHVDDQFFEVFSIPVLTGRALHSGDVDAGQKTVVVSQTIIDTLLGNKNPLGRRLRYVRAVSDQSLPDGESEAWYEIVGVVADRPANTGSGAIYHPRATRNENQASLAIRIDQSPAAAADRLRELTAALGPTLRLDEVLALSEIYRQRQVGNNIGALSLALITLSVLLLSVAGMYALMSFTVNQQRREIGIRSALGAQPSRLLAGVFKRSLLQVAAGACVGALGAFVLGVYVPIERLGGWNVKGVLPAATIFMIVLSLLAALGPARRGLRVEPSEALKEG